ncbi:MAG TPA: HDOD domain-containing protein [Lachnospiraceae bacterium]|jgi:c-di-GMP-related signal transduction protein|nr:HDOD domain-containing protein [Lachnospiraceae bacterium]
MLATIIPFFDKDMKVSAYSLFSQKENFFLNPGLQGFGRNDGVGFVDGLEVIQNMGIDTLSPDTDVFVPVGNISVFSDIEAQCSEPHNRLVLLFDNSVTSEELYVNRVTELKSKGYKLAMRKLPVSEYEQNKEILKLMDYIILDCKKIDVTKAKLYFGQVYPNIRICVGNVDNQEKFDELKDDPSFEMFEGEFYRIPVTKGETEVAPLKANYLQLLKMVNDEDFELTKAADIIGRDTALVLELLQMVNRMSVNSGITTIRHAAAMLGQKELKKWINTAVTKELCTDRPNEITRLSLLRAKFAETLAPIFGLTMKSSELFLVGLFSVLDLILNLPMEEALDKIRVSKEISEALVHQKGELAAVLDFMLHYEAADWQEVSRQMIIMSISMDAVYAAYIESVRWYKDVFFS